MKLDPTVRFWFSIALFVGSGIAGGALKLTNMVPDAWIDPITAYVLAFNFIGNGIMAALNGAGTTMDARLDSTNSIPTKNRLENLVNTSNGDIKQIKVASKSLADAVPSDVVVGPGEPPKP